MRNKWMCLLPLVCAQQLSAQLPDFYKKVDRITWVVTHADKVAQAWSKLGFESLQAARVVVLSRTQFQGKPAKSIVKVAAGRLGPVQIRWIQPVSGRNAYSEFLARHGEGVFSLVHRVPTREALTAEVARLADLNVGVLESGDVESGLGIVSYAYMNTEREGKYSLGLIYVADTGGAEVAAAAAPDMKLSQYAFVVRDLRAVSAYWKKLGFPAMSFTHPALRELVYQGNPGQFDQELGWQRHGQIVYEWIQPLRGPTAYMDHQKAHGEGLHHLAFDVSDIDRMTALLSKHGFPRVQSGAWGEEGKPGSGKFAYSDTGSIGGIAVEFLWNFK